MSSSSTRPLDQIEQMLVDQTRSLDGFTHRSAQSRSAPDGQAVS